MAKTLYVRGCHNRQDREQDRRYFSTLSVAINDNNNNNNVFFSVPFLLWSTKPLLISPLTARVVGAPQMISQAVSSIFSLFSTALWDFANSRPVHSLMLSSYLFLYLPCLLTLSLCLTRWFWPDQIHGRHDHTTAVCISLRSSGGLRVVQLPAGSWHGLPRW